MVCLLFVASIISPQLAGAQSTLTSSEEEYIKANCQSIKSILNQLHVSDALLRVNRGQLYQSIVTKLMDRFNLRLSTNSINNDQFVRITNDYRLAFKTFSDSYVAYEQQLSRALAVDCQRQPSDFRTEIAKSRELRLAVHDNVNNLNELVNDYQQSVDDFLSTYRQATTGGSND